MYAVGGSLHLVRYLRHSPGTKTFAKLPEVPLQMITCPGGFSPIHIPYHQKNHTNIYSLGALSFDSSGQDNLEDFQPPGSVSWCGISTGCIRMTSLHCVSSSCLSEMMQKSHWLQGRELLKKPLVQAARWCRLPAVVGRIQL